MSIKRRIPLMARLLAWMQSRCVHPEEYRAADILHGALGARIPGYALSWCRLCGAYRIAFDVARPTGPTARRQFDWIKPDATGRGES